MEALLVEALLVPVSSGSRESRLVNKSSRRIREDVFFSTNEFSNWPRRRIARFILFYKCE
jgi:hypothetical protein